MLRFSSRAAGKVGRAARAGRRAKAAFFSSGGPRLDSANPDEKSTPAKGGFNDDMGFMESARIVLDPKTPRPTVVGRWDWLLVQFLIALLPSVGAYYLAMYGRKLMQEDAQRDLEKGIQQRRRQRDPAGAGAGAGALPELEQRVAAVEEALRKLQLELPRDGRDPIRPSDPGGEGHSPGTLGTGPPGTPLERLPGSRSGSEAAQATASSPSASAEPPRVAGNTIPNERPLADASRGKPADAPPETASGGGVADEEERLGATGSGRDRWATRSQRVWAWLSRGAGLAPAWEREGKPQEVQKALPGLHEREEPSKRDLGSGPSGVGPGDGPAGTSGGHEEPFSPNASALHQGSVRTGTCTGEKPDGAEIRGPLLAMLVAAWRSAVPAARPPEEQNAGGRGRAEGAP